MDKEIIRDQRLWNFCIIDMPDPTKFSENVEEE